MKADKIKSLMNQFGKERKSFLFAIDYNLENGYFIENPLSQSEILFKTPLATNKTDEKIVVADKKLQTQPISFEEYKSRFNKVMKYLKCGNSDLVNLTVKTPIQINIDLMDIFAISNSPYGLYVPDHFVCFSPERFVKITDGIISTNPMKGTISADIPDAEKIILESKKESIEHASIVELMQNELAKIAQNVEVKRYRYIDRINTKNGDILQVSSEIEGKLPENYLSELGDIIFSLLPAGSISAAPKETSMQIIKKSENYDRGFYTGVFGYFDGKELDSGVLIRYIEKDENGTFFYSGGGITAQSNAQDEYNEVLKKIYLPFK